MAQFISFGDGHDGSATGKSGTINTYASMTGSAGSTTVTTALSVAVGDIVLLHQSRGTANVGKWELVRVASTGAGSFTADRKLVNTYASVSQAVLMPQYSAGTISGAITGTSWGGTSGGIIAFLCNGALSISGSVNADSAGHRGGNSTSSAAYSGEGSLGDRNTRNASYGTASGGYASSRNQGGAGGGNGSDGSRGAATDTAVSPGSTGGSVDLTNAIFGGGGGTSQAIEQQSSAIGGSGGGFILIIAKDFTLSGNLYARGGAGGNSTGGDYSRGGGGGAGGSILIKTQKATLGSSRAVATGGAGGTATGGVNGNINGGAGGTGRIRLDYLLSYSGSTNPTMSVAQDDNLRIKSGGSFLTFL